MNQTYSDKRIVTPITPLRVYLAGKISEGSWRRSLLDTIGPVFDSNAERDELAICHSIYESSVIGPVAAGAVDGGHDYVGPYAVDVYGGHGNPYDEGGHGVNFTEDPLEPVVSFERVHAKCLMSVISADVVFAYLSQPDVYGTISEIAYASARGKEHIWIAMTPEFERDYGRDFWFVRQFATDEIIEADPLTAWRTLLDRNITRNPRTMPYNEYLQTPHWKETRKAALERAGNRCQLCNNDQRLHVHHRTYERLGEEHDTDLIVLCASCHGRFHRGIGKRALASV